MSAKTENRPVALRLALERGVTNPPGQSPWHGEDHWKSVALVGFYLARWTPGADMEFIFTFAMLHDLMRENEYEDPQHGTRASHLFMALCDEPGLEHFPPYSQPMFDMCYALSHHNTAENARGHANVNVGICWDADRLTLPRVGETPKPRYLTTEASRKSAAVLLAYGLCMRQLGEDQTPLPTWPQIAEEIQRWRH